MQVTNVIIINNVMFMIVAAVYNGVDNKRIWSIDCVCIQIVLFCFYIRGILEKLVCSLKAMQLDLSGSNGQSKMTFPTMGNYGWAGDPGCSGSDGRNVTVHLSPIPNSPYINVCCNSQNSQFALHSAGKILIRSVGGNGGKGGDGGNGRAGDDGTPGADATTYSVGGYGGRGGDGGPGGDGGRGGNGGNGGHVQVRVAEEDMDLLALLGPVDVSGGRAGTGGSGGSGGRGGAGGRGGYSHSWSTPKADGHGGTIYDNHYHAAGSSGFAGSTGSSGSDGNGGCGGQPGRVEYVVTSGTLAGSYSGIYDLRLLAVGITPNKARFEPGEVYRISSVRYRNDGLMPSPPRCGLLLNRFTGAGVSCVGSGNRLGVSIAPGCELTVEADLFSVHIPEHNEASVETDAPADALDHSITYAVGGGFERVSSMALQSPTYSLQVGFPLIMSPVSGPRSVNPQDGRPTAVALKLRNVGENLIGIGRDYLKPGTVPIAVPLAADGSSSACPARPAEVVVHCASAGLTFRRRATHGQLMPTEEPLQEGFHVAATVDRVQPFCLSGILCPSKLQVDTFTQVTVSFSLRIGKVHNYEQMHTVQRRSYRFILTEPYAFIPRARLVLMVNEQVARRTIDSWRAFAQSLRTNLAVWDLSYYGGIDLQSSGSIVASGDDAVTAGTATLLQQFSGKIIVLCNNTFTDSMGNVVSSLGYLTEQCMLEAARRYNIRFYVLGGSFKWSEGFVPPQSRLAGAECDTVQFPSQKELSAGFKCSLRVSPSVPQSVAEVAHVVAAREPPVYGCSVPSKCLGSNTPNYDKFSHKGAALARELGEKFPFVRFQVVEQFAPQHVSGTVWKNWTAGTFTLLQGLDFCEARVIHRQGAAEGPLSLQRQVDRADWFQVFKLTPFEFKLDLLLRLLQTQGSRPLALGEEGEEQPQRRFPETPFDELLRDSIVSDLFEEQLAFAEVRVVEAPKRRFSVGARPSGEQGVAGIDAFAPSLCFLQTLLDCDYNSLWCHRGGQAWTQAGGGHGVDLCYASVQSQGDLQAAAAFGAGPAIGDTGVYDLDDLVSIVSPRGTVVGPTECTADFVSEACGFATVALYSIFRELVEILRKLAAPKGMLSKYFGTKQRVTRHAVALLEAKMEELFPPSRMGFEVAVEIGGSLEAKYADVAVGDGAGLAERVSQMHRFSELVVQDNWMRDMAIVTHSVVDTGDTGIAEEESKNAQSSPTRFDETAATADESQLLAAIEAGIEW